SGPRTVRAGAACSGRRSAPPAAGPPPGVDRAPPAPGSTCRYRPRPAPAPPHRRPRPPPGRPRPARRAPAPGRESPARTRSESPMNLGHTNRMATDLTDRLAETIRAGRADGLHGRVVSQAGNIILEHYGAGADFAWWRSLGQVQFGPDTLHDIRSVTKSVTALLYGIALAAGQVPAPAESLLDHLPEYADTGKT